MDALSNQGPPSPLLIDALTFNINCVVRRKHSFDDRTWTFSEIAQELGWSNALFQAARSVVNVGGRAVQASGVLRRGLRWTLTFPIPLQIKGKNGKLRRNPARDGWRHVWWRVGSGWHHAVISSAMTEVLVLLAERAVVGIDTADRRGRGRASRFTGWTARITDLRALGIPISTTPTEDWSRNVHRVHCEVRFQPPPAGETATDLAAVLMTDGVLDKSEAQIGVTMGQRATAARAKAAQDAARFRREWAALEASA